MKKTFKTVLSLLLALAVVFCFAACGDDKDKEPAKELTSEEVYAKALENTRKLSSYSMKNLTTLGMNIMGMDMDLKIETSAEVAGLKTDDVIAKVVYSENSDPVTYFYSNDIVYYEAEGTKSKTAMDFKAFSNQFGIYDDSALDDDMPAFADFKDLKYEKKDGLHVYEFIMDSTSSFVQDIIAGFTEGADASDVTVGSLSMTIKVSEDLYIAGFTLTTSVTMAIEGIGSSMEISLDIAYNNPGKDVTVTLPADLDSYH